MKKGLIIAGIVIIAIALILVALFPAAFYKPAKNVNSDDYKDGDKITVYGTITKIVNNTHWVRLTNISLVVLDDNLTVFIPGELKHFEKGDYVYMTIEKTSAIHIGNWEVSYWKGSKDDIHYVSDVHFYLYVIMAIGIIIAAVGVILR